MKQLIHRYLNDTFWFSGNFLLRRMEFKEGWYAIPLSSYTIVEELKLIFGLSKKQLKWYIKSWFANSRICFNAWWDNYNKDSTITILMKKINELSTRIISSNGRANYTVVPPAIASRIQAALNG